MSRGDEKEGAIVRDTCRQTTFGFSSQDHDEMDKIIGELVNVYKLSLTSLVTALEKFPYIRQETRLIKEISKKSELVSDMIAFLLEPHSMSQKYNLKKSQTARYIKNIAYFMKQNFEFYEYYFILLQDNSIITEKERQNSTSERQLHRTVINSKQTTLDQWFNFLQKQPKDQNELYASLGYLSQIFIPFIKYEFSSSSNVTDYYEEKYTQIEYPILLVTHFSEELVQKITKYTHYQPVFKCLFSLVLVSLEEQEWTSSLTVLTRLCDSAITDKMTSDLHIENLYKMLKEVSDNISSDKNRTVFGFLSAIIKQNIVEASLNRLLSILNHEENKQQCQLEWIIEINLKFLVEVTNIYFFLLKNGIDKNTTKMKQLKCIVLNLKEAVPQLTQLVKKIPQTSISFSNGQTIKRTPIYKHTFFCLIKGILECRDHEEDEDLRMDKFVSELIELIQSCLAQNRWNSIMHSIIQKIVGLLITTDLFKTKDKSLDKFLEFLIQNFTNKKYVFLNSTRMANQGDTRSLYNICCKITISFEKACKRFGISNQYEEWSSFVVNVLQNYDNNIERASSVYINEVSDSVELKNSIEMDKNEGFSGYIDEAAEMKQSISRIDTIQKWRQDKDLTIKKLPLQRTTSFEKLDKRKGTDDENRRDSIDNPSPTSSKPRLGGGPEKPYNSVFELKEKKISEVQGKEQLVKPPEISIDRILSLTKQAESTEEETERKIIPRLSSFQLDLESSPQKEPESH